MENWSSNRERCILQKSFAALIFTVPFLVSIHDTAVPAALQICKSCIKEAKSYFKTVEGLSFSVEDIQTEPGATFDFRITLPTLSELAEVKSEKGAFILVRKVPRNIVLSAGMLTGENWILPLEDAKSLQGIASKEIEGIYPVEFVIIGSGNSLLATETIIVNIQNLNQTNDTNAVTSRNISNKKNSEFINQQPPLKPDEEQILLSRAKQLKQEGGIAAARLILEELANNGSAEGALELARSYDPAFISDIPNSPFTPDISKALKWYERAVELGNSSAAKRLAELSEEN